MDIESISGAATVALACTLVFLLVAKSWQLIIRSVGSTPNFSDSIMREAAQRFRDEFERLSRSRAIYLSAGVVFIVLFVSAYTLNAERLFAGYPIWQLYLLLAALSAAAVVAARRLLKTVLECHRIKLRRDANIAIGHQLQRIAAGPVGPAQVHDDRGVELHQVEPFQQPLADFGAQKIVLRKAGCDTVARAPEQCLIQLMHRRD